VGIWAKAKEVKEGISALVAQWAVQRNEGPDDHTRPEQPAVDEDPVEGYSALFASELIDDQTCANCAAIDGHEYASMAEARADYPAGEYPAGGYKGCESESGCRGTLILMREDG
jgi:hypothetical protein